MSHKPDGELSIIDRENPSVTDSSSPQNSRRNRLPNAFIAAQFRPGQSGNPGGRPQRRPITDQIVKLLQETTGTRTPKTVARLIAEALVRAAQAGDTRAIQTLLERTEGKLPANQTAEGEAGGTIRIEILDVGSDDARA